MNHPYYETDPYEAVFSKMDVMGNIAAGHSGRDQYLRAVAAMDSQRQRGTACPRCGRVGSSCTAAYCIYG